MTSTTTIKQPSERMPTVLIDPVRPSQRAPAVTSADAAQPTRQTATRPHFISILFMLLVVGGGFAALYILGSKPRQERVGSLEREAAEVKAALPRVSVIKAKRSAPLNEVVLPGEVQPVRETSVYARTTGYLKRWTVDIGDSVTAGQLLAEIDSPEIDMQLEQSRAVLKQQQAALGQAQANIEQTSAQLGSANANSELADLTNKRYQLMKGTAAVTEQDLSEKETAFKIAKAAIAAAKASVASAEAAAGVARANIVVAESDVKRLEVLKSFELIYAPFAGTITSRQTENGALVMAGSSTTGGQPLFRLACSDPVRLYIDVPQIYAPSIKHGQDARLVLRELPASNFTGKVTRTTKSIDPASRTLHVEVEVENKSGTLLPGMYAQVKLSVAKQVPPLLLPGSALIVNAHGTQVAIVRESKIHYEPVTLDGDYGTNFGVVAGLTEQDEVVTNPSERLVEGAPVEVAK